MSLTRWVWIKEQNGAYVLAFTYFDSQAGPSAKGGVVTDVPESWANAVEHPDRTFRDPKAFGATPLTEEEAKRRGLPDEPPWLSIFTEGVARVAAATDGTRITGRVLLDGAPTSFGVDVSLGILMGNGDFLPVDKCAPDGDGTFSFAAPAKGEHALIAEGGSLGSAYAPATVGAPITLNVFRVATLNGRVQRNGKGERAQVQLKPKGHVARQRLTRADREGAFSVTGLTPGRYSVEVMGLDRGGMINGTPTTDELELATAEIAERTYTLVSGVAVRVTVETHKADNSENAHVYLLTGTVTPQCHGDVRPLFRTPALRSANSLSRKGGIVSTQFLDVAPGPYTLVSLPDRFGQTTDQTPVVFVHFEVGGADQDVKLSLPR